MIQNLHSSTKKSIFLNACVSFIKLHVHKTLDGEMEEAFLNLVEGLQSCRMNEQRSDLPPSGVTFTCCEQYFLLPYHFYCTWAHFNLTRKH